MAIFISHPVLPVMISLVLLTAEVLGFFFVFFFFFKRGNMTGTVTRSAMLSGCKLKRVQI